MKLLMTFVATCIQETAELGPSALDLNTNFDEHATISTFAGYLSEVSLSGPGETS